MTASGSDDCAQARSNRALKLVGIALQQCAARRLQRLEMLHQPARRVGAGVDRHPP